MSITLPVKKTLLGIACSSLVLALMLHLVGDLYWRDVVTGFSSGMTLVLCVWAMTERP